MISEVYLDLQLVEERTLALGFILSHLRLLIHNLNYLFCPIVNGKRHILLTLHFIPTMLYPLAQSFSILATKVSMILTFFTLSGFINWDVSWDLVHYAALLTHYS